MRILIEEHQYPADIVNHVLEGITTLRNVNNMINVNHVGYFYNPFLRDCVFILPKVLLEDVDGKEMVFGKYTPEELIHLDAGKVLSKPEHDFIYELAVWIYRAIVVYRNSNPSNTIIKQQNAQEMSRGRMRHCNTYLDILLALIKFNDDNQNFFFYILRNIHSGFNKINWTRTISQSEVVIQKNFPVYLNPINKKKKINFDEELLIIFYSILNYIQHVYGFPVQLNVNYPLIKGRMFERYLTGMGKIRLKQIKYKYFSDKSLYLWDLCYAFFDQSKEITIETNEKEYLLAQDFNIVFEAIIDELVGDKDIPKELKKQDDGKRVDHLYMYHELTNNAAQKQIYYIGDSKYYKRNTNLGKESVYKQFTYAKNVIQWNIDLFNDTIDNPHKGHVKLRDDVTEGYNIIPNFFISAQQKSLKRLDNIKLTDKDQKYFQSDQFKNRLFDRDTFLVAHYDVNFLFVIALYGRNNTTEKLAWKRKVRKMFRSEIQDMLEQKFEFYVMTAKENVYPVNYIQEHFQQLLGKVFTPYENRGMQKYFSLALDRGKEFVDENSAILAQLKDAFYITPCRIGDAPSSLLPKVSGASISTVPDVDYLTHHYLEKYLDKSILIGCYKDKAHLEWILGKNDKGTLIYNIRLGKEREGGQIKSHLDDKTVRFVVLYEFGHESENNYRVFRVHHHATMTAERLVRSMYPSDPKSKKYFCYVFDEEISLGRLDINSLLSTERINNSEFVEGMPVFVKGKELIKYRR